MNPKFTKPIFVVPKAGQVYHSSIRAAHCFAHECNGVAAPSIPPRSKIEAGFPEVLMNLLSQRHKHRVEIEDYPYERDIALRLLMASLSSKEVAIVEEIVNGSLRTSATKIAQRLRLAGEQVELLLEKLANEQVVDLEGDLVLVNKEMRRLLECELGKFSSHFHADLNYLQQALSKVPIHILPQWYAIPKMSDNIFQSLLERYFLHPKSYSKHLDELAIDHPLLHKLVRRIEQTEEGFVSASELMREYGWDHNQFERTILELEYNLGGFLVYRPHPSGQGWQEGVTLLREWLQYRHFLKEEAPKPMLEQHQLIRYHPSDFAFVDDLTLLSHEPTLPIGYERLATGACLGDEASYFHRLVEVAIELGLFDEKGQAHGIEQQKWRDQSKQERALSVYGLFIHGARQKRPLAKGCREKELRDLEKALRVTFHRGWFSVDQFLDRLIAAMGIHAPISLVSKGRKWLYQLPEHGPAQKALFSLALKEIFWPVGLVALGQWQGEECFCVTPFGRMTLEE